MLKKVFCAGAVLILILSVNLGLGANQGPDVVVSYHYASDGYSMVRSAFGDTTGAGLLPGLEYFNNVAASIVDKGNLIAGDFDVSQPGLEMVSVWTDDFVRFWTRTGFLGRQFQQLAFSPSYRIWVGVGDFSLSNPGQELVLVRNDNTVSFYDADGTLIKDISGMSGLCNSTKFVVGDFMPNLPGDELAGINPSDGFVRFLASNGTFLQFLNHGVTDDCRLFGVGNFDASNLGDEIVSVSGVDKIVRFLRPDGILIDQWFNSSVADGYYLSVGYFDPTSNLDSIVSINSGDTTMRFMRVDSSNSLIGQIMNAVFNGTGESVVGDFTDSPCDEVATAWSSDTELRFWSIHDTGLGGNVVATINNAAWTSGGAYLLSLSTIDQVECPILEADFTDDCTVDFDDLAIFVLDWLEVEPG